MATKGKEEERQHLADDEQVAKQAGAGWMGTLQRQYHRIREHAETYPYVWGSYIVVYGGFGLWFAYRMRKLRRTEDRVRVIQLRLRKLVEAEESGSSAAAAAAEKAPPPPDKPKN